MLDEKREEALYPLLSDGNRRRENDCWPANPVDNLQTKNCLARTGGSDDMKPSVIQMLIYLFKDMGLIITPNPFEVHMFEHEQAITLQTHCANDIVRQAFGFAARRTFR